MRFMFLLISWFPVAHAVIITFVVEIFSELEEHYECRADTWV